MVARNKQTERFARYDSADYLKTPEEVAAYLVAAFEEGGDDAAYMAHVIGIAARAHGGMTKLAKETGMTRAGLYKALSKDGNPSFDTIVRAMRVLGVRLVPELASSRELSKARRTSAHWTGDFRPMSRQSVDPGGLLHTRHSPGS
ncbi:MAG: addiction module antidote protein [Steroidobacteraceae bacterium]